MLKFRQTYKIDAADRAVGRVASEIAQALRGKMLPDFERHLNSQIKVEVTNAGKMRLPQNKTYVSYSGYPGGIKRRSIEKIVTEKGPGEVLHRAVRRMLPSNKLRPQLLKQLKIND